MISKRLKQLRLARGLSLDGLAEAMDGFVTKQALSKYETGKAHPSPRVLVRIADVFGVHAAEMLQEPGIIVDLPGYRKQKKLTRREQERLESIIIEEMQKRVRLQEIIGEDPFDLPVQQLEVLRVEDSERAAMHLRDLWSLGRDPITGVVETLENHRVHVIEVDAPEGFDGLSAIARDGSGKAIAAGAVTRLSISGERQRFNVAHELGHLVLKLGPECDAEPAAHRFAAAFLAPSEFVRREIGSRRSTIQLDELRFLRRRYGISLQAAVRRLKDLEIISDAVYKEWCINFSRWGWRKQEPDESPREQPLWLRRTVLRAIGEGLMSSAEATSMTGELVAEDVPLSLLEKRTFMKLPLEERRRILEAQARRAAEHYESTSGDELLGGGDFIDEE